MTGQLKKVVFTPPLPRHITKREKWLRKILTVTAFPFTFCWFAFVARKPRSIPEPVEVYILGRSAEHAAHGHGIASVTTNPADPDRPPVRLSFAFRVDKPHLLENASEHTLRMIAKKFEAQGYTVGALVLKVNGRSNVHYIQAGS